MGAGGCELVQNGAQIRNFILVVMNFRIPQQQGTEQVGSSGKASGFYS